MPTVPSPQLARGSPGVALTLEVDLLGRSGHACNSLLAFDTIFRDRCSNGGIDSIFQCPQLDYGKIFQPSDV